MKAGKFLVAAAALAASVGASAQVVGSLGGGYGTFLTMTTAAVNSPCGTCTIGGYTVTGGTIYDSNNPGFAALPPGTMAPSLFLAAGPTPTQPSTVSFGAGIPYISFLWGSPDVYNVLTVTTTAGAQTFSVDGGQPGSTSLGFSTTNGNQSFAQYVQFVAQGTSEILSLTFSNSPSINAFEVANFSVTAVPEPETYALILAGLGALGFITRRRRNGQA